jgi:putative intracellular protease/amidase
MDLSVFIVQSLEVIVAEWEAFARTQLPAAARLPPEALRNHVADILKAVAADIAAAQEPDHEEAFMTDNTKKFLKDDAALRVLGNTAKLSEINYASFDAAFFPGGYGQLWDLASDSKALQVIQDLIEAEKPVAMICHAPAILRDAKKRNGKPLVTGRRLTGFSNSEDDELDLSRHLLFQLETSLKEKGANYVRSAKNWEPFVVEDGALITGQNPGSAPGIAAALCNRLR